MEGHVVPGGLDERDLADADGDVFEAGLDEDDFGSGA
jgi:hypothetical protein